MHQDRLGVQLAERSTAEREGLRVFEERSGVEPDAEGTEGERPMQIDIELRTVPQLDALAETGVESGAWFRQSTCESLRLEELHRAREVGRLDQQVEIAERP